MFRDRGCKNTMSQEEKWPSAYRVVHLTNGVLAINRAQSRTVEITPYLEKAGISLSINNYRDLYSEIYKAGFKIIGVEFYDHAMQADGLYPPTWRAFHKIEGEVWPVTVCEEIWGNLANAAFKKNDYYFLDLARRIQFQITACLWELKSISEAYRRELDTQCRLRQYKNDQRFETQNSLFICMSVHAFLSNIGTLRDYLAEYTAAFLLPDALPEKRITNMATLIKDLRKLDDKSNSIVVELLTAADHNDPETGWLAQMSAYRDMVVHYAPIASASKRGFISTKSIYMQDKEVPGIVMPLPQNPHELKQERSKGALYADIKEWIHASVDRSSDKDSKDALDYCHWILFRISLLAMQLAGFAPYKPEIPVITSRDIKGPIITSHYQSDKNKFSQ